MKPQIDYELDETTSVDLEKEEEEMAPQQIKNPSMYVQKLHLENQILGDRELRVHTRRKITITPKNANLTLLSKMEPKCFDKQEKISIESNL